MVGSGCLGSLCRNMSLKPLSKIANLRSGARLFSTSRPHSADYTHAVCPALYMPGEKLIS